MSTKAKVIRNSVEVGRPEQKGDKLSIPQFFIFQDWNQAAKSLSLDRPAISDDCQRVVNQAVLRFERREAELVSISSAGLIQRLRPVTLTLGVSSRSCFLYGSQIHIHPPSICSVPYVAISTQCALLKPNKFHIHSELFLDAFRDAKSGV